MNNTYLMNSLYHTKKCDFLKRGYPSSDLVCARSTRHFEMTYLQSLDKALDLFVKFNFCESDVYFLNRSKNCMVATYNFVSVYRHEIRVALFPDRAVSRRDAPSEVACLATCKLI